MEINQQTIEKIREFNRYYTVQMELLNSNYLNTNYSLTEVRVLFEIGIHKKCIQDKIVKALHIDKSYLSRILKKLQKNNLIQKSISENDKRNTLVYLTSSGEEEVQNLIHQTNYFINEKILHLNEKECEALYSSFSSILHLLKKKEQSFEIVHFDEKYRKNFIEFNTDWITTFFEKLEKQDIEEFQNIDKEMEKGAMIFFAVENGNALATCMAKPLDATTWEICKLASHKNLPHKGAGSAVFEASMTWALNHGAKRLFILSNKILEPALHIYRKFGFKEIKLENYEYERGNIAFEYIN